MEIKIVIDGTEPIKEYTLMSAEPISFIEVMNQLGLNFYRPCGGVLKCLSCAIRFIYGAPDMTSDDEKALDFSEMRNGWRLGCKCIINKDCKIQVPVSLVGEITSPVDADVDEEYPLDKTNIGIAVDIGTTTIATAVVDLQTGKILRQNNCTNNQIKYGADVMSRIKASMDGHGEDLMNIVREDLIKIGRDVVGEDFLTHKIVFSANTVMTHLFLNYPVDGLANYPFVPYTTEAISFVSEYRDVFFMPPISAFVGGDIVAGLYFLKKKAMERSEKASKETFLLVDLGTNAEIVLFDGEKYWCSSASAGPALEGASISCGVASVKGAINHLSISEGKIKYTTIGGEKPVGLCGSGIIDMVHELHRNKIIDDGGLLIEKYADTGFPVTDNIYMTGEDIQQVLLAKSAIYSAITVLAKKAGIAFEEIEHLYISGGLGATASVWSSAGINLFPSELINKYESVGNSSLLGAIAYVMDSDQAAITEIKEKSEVVILANDPEFEALFLENLMLK
ncbi:MAG: ASKHA domain-containing protein [Pseudobutyrivibrio sp.]|nr:ASKHA domain-containing protein [Pseudobutyrivibrio sp.]